MRKRRVTVTLPEEVAEYAGEVARRTGRSRSAIIEEAIKNLRRAEAERFQRLQVDEAIVQQAQFRC